jgi:hypothetical protein
MRKKLAALILSVVVSGLISSDAQSTLYDIDHDVNIIDLNWDTTWIDDPGSSANGHVIRTYSLTIQNHDVIPYENVALLLQWAWVKEWRVGVGEVWMEMPYETMPKQWHHPDPGINRDEVFCKPFDQNGFQLLGDVVNINLALQIPVTFEGAPFDEASVALTDSVPYWIVGDGTIDPGEQITITAKVEYWEDDPIDPDYPLFLAGDVIGTPVPEPGFVTLLLLSVCGIFKRK